MKSSTRRWSVAVGATLFGLALLGLLVAVSGIIPVKASSGHWAPTRAFLQFAKRRSIATHTLFSDPPARDKPWLVLKGAGHYETGCSPCHGSPDLEQPGVVGAMTPAPPRLAPLVSKRTPEELFHVVKHGIKFTGMPAWPSQRRDDEVSAVVAFLLALPELDARTYRGLVYGEAESSSSTALVPDSLESSRVPRVVAENCARCHGLDGLGRGSAAFPKLAGQRRQYLEASLSAYAERRRHSGIMQPIAIVLKQSEMRDLAEYYSSLRPASRTEPVSKEAARRGEEIARHGLPEHGIPSCVDCHGPRSGPQNPGYPALAGQYSDYLVLQLELFKSGRRGGSPYGHLMDHVATRLTRDQMQDVARYYASLAGGDASLSRQ